MSWRHSTLLLTASYFVLLKIANEFTEHRRTNYRAPSRFQSALRAAKRRQSPPAPFRPQRGGAKSHIFELFVTGLLAKALDTQKTSLSVYTRCVCSSLYILNTKARRMPVLTGSFQLCGDFFVYRYLEAFIPKALKRSFWDTLFLRGRAVVSLRSRYSPSCTSRVLLRLAARI